MIFRFRPRIFHILIFIVHLVITVPELMNATTLSLRTVCGIYIGLGTFCLIIFEFDRWHSSNLEFTKKFLKAKFAFRLIEISVDMIQGYSKKKVGWIFKKNSIRSGLNPVRK